MEIYNFKYTNYYKHYMFVIKMFLKDCLCKHILSEESQKAKLLKKESLKIGYTQVQWGYAEKFDIRKNRIIQIGRISRIIYKDINRPIRVVIGNKGEVWIDNLHHAIAHIIAKGQGVLLGDIPMYIVDMRNEKEPIIVDKEGSLSRSLDEIIGTLCSAKKRCDRSSQRICSLKYTIEDFMNDNVLVNEEFPLA